MADEPATPTNETDDTAPLNETDNEHIKLWVMEDVKIPTEILNDRTGLQPDALAPVLCWMMHEAIKNPKRNIISAFNLKQVLLHRLIRAKNVESNHTTWVEGATFAEPHQVFSARIDAALSYATDKGWLKIDAAVQPSFGGEVNIMAEGCTIATSAPVTPDKAFAEQVAENLKGAAGQQAPAPEAKPRGVSMLDAALLFDDEPSMARGQKKRWQKSGIKSPEWIGHHPKDRQITLATPQAMLAYVKRVETTLPKSEAAFLYDLKVKAIEAIPFKTARTARTADKMKYK